MLRRHLHLFTNAGGVTRAPLTCVVGLQLVQKIIMSARHGYKKKLGGIDAKIIASGRGRFRDNFHESCSWITSVRRNCLTHNGECSTSFLVIVAERF